MLTSLYTSPGSEEAGNRSLIKLFRNVIAARKLSALMHPLVYEHEILAKDFVDALVENKSMQIISLDETLICDEGRRRYYEYLVPELYKRLTGKAWPAKDIFAFWAPRHSLGEVHSVAMCIVCGFGLFLSDDKDSKTLQQIVTDITGGQTRIEVYNRAEIVKGVAKDCKLPRHDRMAFGHKAI